MKLAAIACIAVLCLILQGCAARRPGTGGAKPEATDGAGQGKAETGKILAKGGGILVTEGTLDERIALMKPMGRKRFSSPRGKRRLLTAMSETLLLYGESRKQGLDKDPKVRALVEIYERNQAVEMLRKSVLDAVTLDEKDLREAYDQQKDRYRVPRKVKVSQIVLETTKGDADDPALEKEARGLAERARGGEDFASLAKKFSHDKKSGARGGEIGFITRRSVPPAVYEAAMKLEKAGDVSDPVRSGTQLRVLKVTEIVPERTKPFEEVRPWMEKSLLNGKKRQVWNDYLEGLKKTAGLEIYEERIELDGKEGKEGGKAPLRTGPPPAR